MGVVRKWLVPALTCLIVLGAAVLPPYISRTRDARQFGQVHAEALDAGALPVREPSTLLDRMALYASRLSSSRTILSSSDYTVLEDSQQRELARAAQDLLVGAGVLPKWLFREEEPFDDVMAARLLLWDAEEAAQAPVTFWDISWDYNIKSHQKSVQAVLDAETGLPIQLYVHDTNMSQWMAYDTEHLQSLVERYFDLLGLEVRQTDLDGTMYVPSVNLSYSIAGTGLNYFASRGPTDLSIQLDTNWMLRPGNETTSTGYDG